MMEHAQYTPAPAYGAHIKKTEEPKWELVLVRELRHSPEKVWQALTDPAQLREWAPFEADSSLATVGAKVKLTTVGQPPPHNVFETTVTRADAPKALEYTSWGNPMRWELEPHAGGTRLTLWTMIDRRFIAMSAAGWHICFEVLDRAFGEAPYGRIAGPDVMKLSFWGKLHADYAQLFGVELPNWGAKS